MEKNGKKSLFSIEITTGSLWKNILLFSLPLMMTQVLEVLFNLSDVAIAGKFADYLALGAVGSTTLLVSLFTGLLIGIGSGVNVVVARGLGLGSHEDVEKTIHTSLLICSGIGIVVCLVCLLLAKPMLLLLNTKEELLSSPPLPPHPASRPSSMASVNTIHTSFIPFFMFLSSILVGFIFSRWA